MLRAGVRRSSGGVGPPFPATRRVGLALIVPPSALALVFNYFASRPLARHHRFWNVLALWGRARLFGFLLVPPPIGAGCVVARCPCRAPAPGVLPGAPSRTRLKALPYGRRVVGGYAPSFFVGWRTHLRAAFSMVSPCRCPQQGLPIPKPARMLAGSTPFAGAHAARAPLVNRSLRGLFL